MQTAPNAPTAQSDLPKNLSREVRRMSLRNPHLVGTTVLSRYAAYSLYMPGTASYVTSNKNSIITTTTTTSSSSSSSRILNSISEM